MVLAAMIMAALLCLATAPRPIAAAGAILGWGLLVLATVDLAELRLPDVLTLPLTGLGLLVASLGGSLAARPAWSVDTLVSHSLGTAAGYAAFAGLAAVYRRLRGHEGLGLGDAKLAACAGAWLGWRPLPAMVLLACLLAFVWVGLRFARGGRETLSQPLAFGAPMALAIWVIWLLPPVWWIDPT